MRLKNDGITLTLLTDLAPTDRISTGIDAEGILDLRENLKISGRQTAVRERCLLAMALTEFCCDDGVGKVTTNLLLKT